jgi:TolB-like protein
MCAQERPTIAFARIDADAERGEIAADLSDDLVAALTRSGLAVTTHAARYRLHGAIRTDAAGEPRLSLQLTNQVCGRLLWAQRFDDVLRHDAESGEQLAARIAASLQPHLRRAEIERACAKPETELTAYDLALRAMPGVLSLDALGNTRALELLQRALEMAPEQGLPAALAAWVHAQRVVYHFSSDTAVHREQGLALARQVGTQSSDATVLCVIGNALTLLHELADADQVISRALAIDGGSAWAWSRVSDRTLPHRPRPRTAGPARLQQHGGNRLRVFQGRPLSRGGALAAARAAGAPVGTMGAPDDVPGLSARGSAC